MKPIVILFGVPILGIIIALLWGCDDANFEPLCDRPDVGSTEAYIIDGTPSVDRRATVKVYLAGGYCSGTVVGPHTVLLAGHCADPRVIAIEDIAAFDVVEDIAHPLYNGELRYDLRLAYTEGVLPEPYAELVTDEDECVQLIAQGYGFGSDGELHERRVWTTARYDEVIITTQAICNGDSGGPLWAVRADGSYVLVGVTSFGFGEYNVCDGPTGFVNLLVLGSWVEVNIR